LARAWTAIALVNIAAWLQQCGTQKQIFSLRPEKCLGFRTKIDTNNHLERRKYATGSLAGRQQF
jgi:hypothetical protein